MEELAAAISDLIPSLPPDGYIFVFMALAEAFVPWVESGRISKSQYKNLLADVFLTITGTTYTTTPVVLTSPRLLVCNHFSVLTDWSLIIKTLKGDFKTVMLADTFDAAYALLGGNPDQTKRMYQCMDYINSSRKVKGWARSQIAEAFKAGDSVLVFPTGKAYNLDVFHHAFYPGSFEEAIKANVPVQALALVPPAIDYPMSQYAAGLGKHYTVHVSREVIPRSGVHQRAQAWIRSKFPTISPHLVYSMTELRLGRYIDLDFLKSLRA